MRAIKLVGVTVLTMFVLLILVPAFIVRGCSWRQVDREPDLDPEMVNVWNHKTNELMELPLGVYLQGVVAAEMPAQFHIEALKAQAVVARSYSVNKIRSLGGAGCDRHPQADICTDSTHCQAWISREDALAKWPLLRQGAYWDKITSAVGETRGLMVLFEGKPIDSVFHSTCGGHTENSEDVWTNKISYLRGVECGFCSHSPRFTERVTMSIGEAASKLSVNPNNLDIQVVKRSDTGRLITVSVDGQQIRGLEFRSALGLRSSKVTWLRDSANITFTSTGYGHAVGLCQYGADGMAEQGYTFIDILQHYYTNVQVQQLRHEE